MELPLKGSLSSLNSTGLLGFLLFAFLTQDFCVALTVLQQGQTRCKDQQNFESMLSCKNIQIYRLELYTIKVNSTYF